MWKAGLLALVVAQAVARGCNPASPTTPSTTVEVTPPGTTAGAVTTFAALATSETITTADGIAVRVETIATGLTVPWSLRFAPDGRLFVTERAGRVRLFTPGGTGAVALTLDDVFTQSEAGLLGLTLDPDFASNRLVYLVYTATTRSGPVNRVMRYRESGGTLGEGVVLLDGIPGHPIHDGGRIRFGPDGLLYVTTGDAADTALPQDIASLAGKILRLNPDGTTPRSNPFSSPVYTWGHRNPQGLDWHPDTGELWAVEHGPTGNDEINRIDAGANYGWPVIQGSQTRPDMRTPLAFFTPSIAPSGASFYTGTRMSAFRNNLFVATLAGNHLLRVRISGSQIVSQERLLAGQFGRLRDVVTGPDGALYFCTNNRDGRGSASATDDRILRIVPAS